MHILKNLCSIKYLHESNILFLKEDYSMNLPSGQSLPLSGGLLPSPLCRLRMLHVVLSSLLISPLYIPPPPLPSFLNSVAERVEATIRDGRSPRTHNGSKMRKLRIGMGRRNQKGRGGSRNSMLSAATEKRCTVEATD